MTGGSSALSSPVDPVATPASAQSLFGSRIGLAEAYASLLATDGVTHGHLGPREVPRIWRRHLENSALLADLLPHGVSLLDVGSGAGLPGIPVAIRRPDLAITLLEPMQRRVAFLERVVAELGLSDQVTVVRGRAEEKSVRADLGSGEWIAARAVAPLDRLVQWCLPLLAQRGRLLALKGESALTELQTHRDIVTRLSGGLPTVVELGGSANTERTWVVSIQRQTTGGRARRGVR